ncbi:MAG: CPBP family intramembrane metalloprotease [Clostridia bacterium]|nr:CPBP family intramembrane metalloprotease [Clostridia bacterium]
MNKRKMLIVALVAIVCLCMGAVDAVIQPGYAAKSAVKLALFLCLPVLYAVVCRDGTLKEVIVPDRKGIAFAALTGAAVYVIVLGAYLIFRNVFDFSALTSSLTSTTGVSKENFLWVALYISFVNSLLEEYFFRGFAFLTLKKQAGRRFAYIFSAAMFALYHIAMMIGWFSWIVIALALAGLFVGGLIFNRFDEKYGNIYMSWLIHMFANFATNTIGFMLFGA